MGHPACRGWRIASRIMKLDKADLLWSKLVRERDGECRAIDKKTGKRCSRRPSYKLEAHHIMPRSRSMARYDLSNGITLCFIHHSSGDDSIHRSPEGSKKFCIKIIGAKEYRRLEKLSLQYKSREKAKAEFLKLYGN